MCPVDTQYSTGQQVVTIFSFWQCFFPFTQYPQFSTVPICLNALLAMPFSNHPSFFLCHLLLCNDFVVAEELSASLCSLVCGFYFFEVCYSLA